MKTIEDKIKEIIYNKMIKTEIKPFRNEESNAHNTIPVIAKPERHSDKLTKVTFLEYFENKVATRIRNDYGIDTPDDLCFIDKFKLARLFNRQITVFAVPLVYLDNIPDGTVFASFEYLINTCGSIIKVDRGGLRSPRMLKGVKYTRIKGKPIPTDLVVLSTFGSDIETSKPKNQLEVGHLTSNTDVGLEDLYWKE